MYNISMVNLSVVIQAGGKSSRMGEDKALMPFVDKNSLIEYILDQIKDQVDFFMVSSMK